MNIFDRSLKIKLFSGRSLERTAHFAAVIKGKSAGITESIHITSEFLAAEDTVVGNARKRIIIINDIKPPDNIYSFK